MKLQEVRAVSVALRRQKLVSEKLMKKPKAVSPTRRRFLQGAATLAGSSLFAGSSTLFSTMKAWAQDPPSCPPPLSGGTHFAPGSDTRPIKLRQSASSLSATQLTELQNAFAAVRALPASDK